MINPDGVNPAYFNINRDIGPPPNCTGSTIKRFRHVFR